MKKLPLVEALAWIIGSTLFITGGTYSLVHGQVKMHRKMSSDPSYLLSRIVQTGPQKQALATAYLAELMQISSDRPTHYGHFDLQKAHKKVLASPVIKEAKIKLLEPDTIYIDYTVRQPLAWLHDFENTAIDDQGAPFPVSPFFTPKNLPEVYLGIDQIAWNKPLEGEKVELALTLLKLLFDAHIPVRRLDLSSAFAESLGRREIILMTEDGGFTRTLRLTTKQYAQELGNYQTLKSRLPATPQVIDLRLPQLAFIERSGGEEDSPQSHREHRARGEE